MLDKIIRFSINNKFIVLLFTLAILASGIYSLQHIPIGAVPDITNNQVQVITTSRNLSTQDVERFLTIPVELEMTNLPGVQEIRSISKFGLSVVTIVFDEDLGTYIPRQLIAEKLKAAEEKIPQGFGTPFMGPITTGLGEIYQYTLEVAPEYRHRYSTMDLRTLQDWTVKRQLAGIPGVVEINTWGGYLKQYEVSVRPDRLLSLNISIPQVFEALEKNHGIAGGGYIEKNGEAFFIRGQGLAASIHELENISIEVRNGTPIYIKDIGTVKSGYANRFGAITANGNGETVMGQIMMLKNANSNEVIRDIKERIEAVQKTLPAGISINPIVERSELISRTTSTILENLILGCLIVILVVLILLGNFRSGLVITSVIPLSLMFAISMMYLLGIDANLMSLGAIDFGIIIDGAVIIVEYISFQINARFSPGMVTSRSESRILIKELSTKGASTMMHSAIFGQIIIVIVFIPILSLTGIEGKMFKPMAMTFCLALVGAMVLCFTYVPALSSVLLRPENPKAFNIGRTIHQFLDRLYHPAIRLAMRLKALTLALSVVLFAVAIRTLNGLGGEFIPTLDEGDFVIQPVLKTGTSLTQTISIITEIEKILQSFPEVEKTASRIGAAEIPTDPMSLEEADVIIKLKPIKTWTSAKTKDELADKFKEKLSVIPGVEFEFTQPIEMRFNELITGVKEDLAIKLYGEDLDELNRLGNEIKNAISGVPGAADIIMDKVSGLPQTLIRYDRDQIAKYGITIAQLNDIISMGFAGMRTGTFFEGEKIFDLVVKLDENYRREIGDIHLLPIPIPGGGQLPLQSFATITVETGPAKISRNHTRRNLGLGINVRNRDLESVVTDIQSIVDEKIKLPPGYTITYGGQFENLRSAKSRLIIAIPIALALILVLLFFAFDSLRDALIIFSAIPLAAIGGIFLLYFRDMPFSISAGVGFIALFGIAVLNGIVLIDHYRELNVKNFANTTELIIQGARQRLRPVMLTAISAALGFLPMAVSSSAGAEVQRPIATVVIGGLVTSTLLTLVLLPILYSFFKKQNA
ncbi:MAG TPA: CusA/CzcA family heavy metal efflux RND transporter [Saprospiraceae bacterium]|nr:CusA/CzcA family heavy metal efflux RND transporter [Saprospiraceae bacterium]HNT21676.1 CusA/CzcA family heavy metal efflux RND transporter [Saprospiraceae bacterium]